MPGFETPTDLMNNRGLIADPDELRAWAADGLEQLF
jgi:hypothetical protein